jgi:hypothetical protein
MSGFFGGGYFYSAGHYDEFTQHNSSCTKCSDWLNNDYILLHKYVKSYYNTDHVIKLLEN